MWFVDENKISKTLKGRNYAAFLVCGVLVVSSSFLTERAVRTGPAVVQELKRTNQSSTPIVPPPITTVDQEDSFKSSNRTSLNATAVSNKVHGNTNRLEFIHITKTGGSAIEAAASHQANIPWGVLSLSLQDSNMPSVLYDEDPLGFQNYSSQYPYCQHAIPP